MAPSKARRRAESFAPAHLTGIFSPDVESRDPRSRGSVGAGLVLEAGVHARVEWRPADRSSVELRGESARPLPISLDVAQRLLALRPGRLRVVLRHELPIGQGFGMSAAGALATGLATASALGVPRQRAIETAHLADLFGGGGLGGVSAILGGGLEVRERPGIPPWGKVRHLRCVGPVFLIVAGGPLPSPKLLLNPRFLQRVRKAASPGLARLGVRPSLSLFLREAERFSDTLRVGPPQVLQWMHHFRAPNIAVAQTMFGRSLFAVPRNATAESELMKKLQLARLSAVRVPIASRGAVAKMGSFAAQSSVGTSPGSPRHRSNLRRTPLEGQRF